MLYEQKHSIQLFKNIKGYFAANALIKCLNYQFYSHSTRKKQPLQSFIQKKAVLEKFRAWYIRFLVKKVQDTDQQLFLKVLHQHCFFHFFVKVFCRTAPLLAKNNFRTTKNIPYPLLFHSFFCKTSQNSPTIKES